MVKARWLGATARPVLPAATAVAVGIAVALPLLTVTSLSAGTYGEMDPARIALAAGATAAYVPIQGWLVLSACRGRQGSRHRVGLAVEAVIVLGVLPVFGVGWLGAVEALAVAVLVTLRWPWSLATYVGLAVVAIGVGLRSEDPRWAGYYGLGLLLVATSMAIPVWLTRTVRQLAAAEQVLAEEAIVQERLRVHQDLERTVEAALAEIIGAGHQAESLALRDPDAATALLRDITDRARSAFADSRGLLQRYRRSSLQTEMAVAATLLRSVGVQVRVQLPHGPPGALSDQARRAFHRDVASLLWGQTAAPTTVTLQASEGRAELVRHDPGTAGSDAGPERPVR